MGIGAFLALAVSYALPQTNTRRDQRHDLPGNDNIRKIDLPIDDWLDQPERTDIPWKVTLSRPVLTFQLRYLVRVQAVVDARVLQRQGIQHDLHFIVKAAEDGIWEETESYSHFPVEARLAKNVELQMLADMYLQPGNYTIAAILYDGAGKRRNVTFTRLQVTAEQGPLPDLLSRLPSIEFLPPPEDAAPLGSGHVLLPVETQRPVQLDLIVDLSTRDDQEPAVNGVDWAPPLYSPDIWPHVRHRRLGPGEISAQERYGRSGLLQTATVLSALDLKDGCVRVAVLDILHRRFVLPFTAADQVDWEKIRRDEVLGSRNATVSVSDLKDKLKSGAFFSETLEQRITQSSECQLEAANPLHAIVLLTRGVHLPSGSAKGKVAPGAECKVFYLQQLSSTMSGDDLKNMLAPLAPTVIEFGDPREFRRKLLEFTQHLEKL